jgi:hypothetical protein
MSVKTILAGMAVLFGTAAASAQTVTTTTTVTSSAPAVAASTPVAADPDDFTAPPSSIVSDARGKLLIGAPLEQSYRESEPLSDGQDTVYVIDSGNLKESGAWTAADSEACKASGGIEIPLPAGRIACFDL